MNREQLIAFTALGLLIMEAPEELSNFMSEEEQMSLRDDIEQYLFPFVEGDKDVVPPILEVVREAIKEQKEKA